MEPPQHSAKFKNQTTIITKNYQNMNFAEIEANPLCFGKIENF